MEPATGYEGKVKKTTGVCCDCCGLDKHEIPKDQKLTKPMLLAPMQAMPHDKEPYVYDKNDPKRAHIMPSGWSQRGSVMWHVIDHRNE